MSEFYMTHDGTLVPGTELEMLRARLAEAEALLHRAAEYVRGFEDAGCGEGECPECQMARVERDIKDYFTSVGG